MNIIEQVDFDFEEAFVDMANKSGNTMTVKDVIKLNHQAIRRVLEEIMVSKELDSHQLTDPGIESGYNDFISDITQLLTQLEDITK